MGKYIIDIEEGKEGVILCQTGIVAVGLHLNDEDSLKPLGIKSAIPYIEPSRGEIYKNAYQKGYETAKHECEDCNVNAVKIADDKAHEAYQKGLDDAWEAARKIVLSREDGGLFEYEERKAVFGCGNYMALKTFLVPEAIEKIRQYEDEQKEQKQEKLLTVEDVMRQYLDTFCKNRICSDCPLYTLEFTCGRGNHFCTNHPVSDEEVRRAYAKVLKNMKVSKNETK